VIDIDQIVAQCKRGNRQAQKQLYEEFAPQLFAVCLRYCSNRMEAEDFLHEGFLKIFEKINQFRGDGTINAWLRKIMVNTVLDEIRNRQKLMYIDDTKMIAVNIADSDEEIENDNETFDIYNVDINQAFELVKQMPQQYKLVFNLYVVEKYSHEMIASELGISKGTSKSNLSRARKWLKDKLENEQIKNNYQEDNENVKKHRKFV
jgi:RNA polymerase sigma-70 factor (ECF subfamily)